MENVILVLRSELNMEKREEALKEAIKQIEKQFGKGAIMTLGEDQVTGVEAVPSGSISLDAALGIGGYPKGRIIEIFGPESSGKTTIALTAIASVQKAGGTAAFIDAEHALDPVYAKNIGVNTEDLLISQPDTGEQGLNIATALVKSGAVDIVVIDSVAALVPEAEINGDMGDSHVGLQARLMSQAMRMMSGAISQTNTLVIFINQLREKVGVMFGNPETTTGGRALKFYASVRIDVRKGDWIKNGSDVIGAKTNLKIVKNKVASPFKSASVDIIFGKGISKYGELVDIAVEQNLLTKSGAWFSYNGEKIAQGRDNAVKYLENNPSISDEIENAIREKLGVK